MKDTINYYYNFDLNHIFESKEYCSFNYNGDNYFFVFFNRTIDELKDLVGITKELNNKGVRVHEFVMNKDNELITKIGSNNYVLLKLNRIFKEQISFFQIVELQDKLRLNNTNSRLYRNNWGNLWSQKIDYFEYQIKELGKNKSIILDSFSYYIGLAENAIGYVNKINKTIKNDNIHITLSHRRIFSPNISLNFYNPLSFIFDLGVRDIAEYLKSEFFAGGNSLLELMGFLKMRRLTNYEYHMLFARLLYPSYYFDVYENIMNNNQSEESILKIVKKVNKYEDFLRESFYEINKYTNLERIDWLIKKEF